MVRALINNDFSPKTTFVEKSRFFHIIVESPVNRTFLLLQRIYLQNEFLPKKVERDDRGGGERSQAESRRQARGSRHVAFARSFARQVSISALLY